MATIEGFERIFSRVSEVLGVRPGYGPPWRFVPNEPIDLDGDRAQMSAYLHDRYHKVGGMYQFDATRRPEGWRPTKLRVELLYQES